MPTMFVIPWRWTSAPRPDRAIVFCSRFDARGLRDRRLLFAAGMQLRRTVLASPGALGVGMRSHLLAGQFFTISMWQDEASLMDFARSREHRSAVRELAQLGPVTGVLVSWDASNSRPRWRDIARKVADTAPGPYHRATATA